MYVFLVALSILAVVIGFFLASQATLGVAVIAAGGVFGVLARIAQANEHQEEILAALGAEKEAAESSRAVDKRLQELAKERGITTD